MKKYVDDFTVIENKRLNHEYVVLTLKHPGQLPEIMPGQFVEVRVDNGPDTFLRRPISIHDIDVNSNTMKLLIQEIGEGTRLMGALKEGDQCNMVYPLGNWFSLPDKPRVLLVGGGCGIAPLLLMGRHLKANGIVPRFLLGARTSEGLIALDEFKQLGEVYTTTEDGSAGTKGFVIHHPVMKTHTPEIDWIYTCGPEAMMKVVAKYAGNHDIRCQVSLENHMACGFGACLCCVAETLDGNKCTCTDGPVFDSTYLKW